MVDTLYKNIQAAIKKADPHSDSVVFTAHYVGTTHKYLGIGTPEIGGIVRDFSKKNPDVNYEDFLNLLKKLFTSDSYEERIIATGILGSYPQYMTKLPFAFVDKWIENLVGWAEIDTLCQNRFTNGDFWARPKAWQTFIRKLNKSKNISKRRASLVLLVALNRNTKTPDKTLHQLGYEMIENIKHEKEILITKAVSWLLRAMSETDPQGVKKYINENLETLPKIAIREALTKIETGTKTKRKV